MYWLYSRDIQEGISRYTRLKETHLFGSKSGFIFKLLTRMEVPSGQNEPYLWHLPVQQSLEKVGHPTSSLVIDVKPKNKKPVVLLHELLDVWGYSSNGWTPLMFRLREIVKEDDATKINREDFQVDESKEHPPIYSFLYLSGSVADGKLTGKWLPPSASPTNSVLLWPPALRYFLSCIRKTTAQVFEEKDALSS